ncbi:hypothetical protein PF005_g4920 [Phytophthora fragariae]|uniref:Uncharacterized protein n=1 Tax=Phytophthora fragariae TaxID=53985 RepID=A0A6A3YZZ7_9STRA|nr:hypothetical protein PF003_g39635 [Phytophthora fragariae]KAE8947967.1 hypothetical protein PF009_g2445 [Phytophthora fragariae]KAE9136108.1 hypothetical protein PF007_g2300 [Phytophthora fragariae]KAE9136138.1 hypothetical protein PF010_g1794 [Phytophthora fragariae]KAE9226947.1 hypothetical protein PF005_g4920 [Phytophthora fragariae]
MGLAVISYETLMVSKVDEPYVTVTEAVPTANFYLYTMTLASVESSDEASGGSFARGRECVDAVESVAVVLDTSVFRVHVERKLVGDAELKKGSPMDVS